MAKNRTINLIGEKATSDLLKAASPQMQKGVMKPALRAAVAPVRVEAKRLVPVRSGNLKKAIVSGVNRAGTQAAVLVSRKHEDTIDGKKYIPGNIAHLVEYGTKTAAPHPFLRPAMEAKKAEAIKILGERARAEIDKRLAKGLK